MPKHVLVVDDEVHVRELIASVLEGGGWAVTQAESGAVGMTALAADPQRFSLAVVDLMMPEMSGHDLIGELRRLKPGLPVVLVSGYSGRELPDEVFTGGPTFAVSKPFRLEHLMKAVADAIGLSK
jgi:CheY-like chemotaxis protein